MEKIGNTIIKPEGNSHARIEKHSLENLVEDVTPFDLSAFKIYDNKTKTYKSINTFEIPNGVDRNSLKKKLKEFNSVLYSIQNNTFNFNCKKA